MNNQTGYNQWANTYDAVKNLTRDVEAHALRQILSQQAAPVDSILELGCGTGKNTDWLLTKTHQLIGVDFSAEMLAEAKRKITAPNVAFQQLDVREKWPFEAAQFDWLTCSLMLEHLTFADLQHVFAEARRVLKPNGLFYLGELHPFKQYQGSKARFETETGVVELACFTHHTSDFFQLATTHHFQYLDLQEWFDDNDRSGVPRILTCLFQRMAE